MFIAGVVVGFVVVAVVAVACLTAVLDLVVGDSE
jgi:hypothetical protein